MRKFIFMLLPFMALLLNADIVFKGDCGSYRYDLNISANRYYGGQCVGGKLYVYYDAGTDYIRGVYADPQVSSSIDIHHKSTGRVYKSFDYTPGDVVFIGSDISRLLYGLAGLLLGLITIQFFYRFILKRG